MSEQFLPHIAGDAVAAPPLSGGVAQHVRSDRET